MKRELSQFLIVGKIINTHGVSGAVKADCHCDSPEVLTSLGTVYTLADGVYSPLRVARSAVAKGRFALLWFEGYSTFEQAVTLKNKVIYAARGDLPIAPGAHFIDDLLGLPVTDADSARVYGTLRDVITGGAQELYEIETPHGAVLMPAVREFIDRIDLEEGIFIRPVEGLFQPE